MQSLFGVLELKIAATLKPDDWVARRGMVLGLVAERLDDQARAEVEVVKRVYPGWERDTLLARAIETLDRRSAGARGVAEF